LLNHRERLFRKVPPMSILAQGSVSDFFHEVVEDALRSRRVEATDGAATYLVSLLADFAKPDCKAEQTLERPLAFLLDEALHAPAPGERFDRLRLLGDGVLYTCGFFGDHFEARGLDQKYLFGIGMTAYGTASSMLRTGQEDAQARAVDVYGELSTKFASFVEVIAEVADTTIAKGVASSKGLLKLYERWLKTKSDRLAQTLSSHGFVPVAGPKGTLQ
jgi:hypothetical protein